ncbi:MAG: adenosylcobinamide amidohydrolase [Betaproteobacteria bacterium]
MEQLDLTNNIKLVVKDNVLAVISQNRLKTVSSAIFNGGNQQVKAVLNIGVPEGYSNVSLHLDPMQLITSSAAKIGVSKDYLAMVTAAKIYNYSLMTKQTDEFSVSVAATAGCSHGESSGEKIDVEEITGTINIIVFIDGNPTDSCLVAALITATEAKSAVLRDFDMRSRYTGDSATGSITDSVTVATNGIGQPVMLAGPASKLGQVVGQCTRRAVTDALLKQEPYWECRTVLYRLKERHLPVEKLATEVSKVKGLEVDVKGLIALLSRNPLAAGWLLAAAKMDDDYKKNLLPADFEDWNEFTRSFSASTPSKHDCSKLPNYSQVDLPPFVKYALIRILQESSS